MEINDRIVDIYFNDLTPEAQQQVLSAFEVTDVTEMNWDTFPIASIPVPEN